MSSTNGNPSARVTSEPLAWRFSQVVEAQNRLNRKMAEAVREFEETTALTVNWVDYFASDRTFKCRYSINEASKNRPAASS